MPVMPFFVLRLCSVDNKANREPLLTKYEILDLETAHIAILLTITLMVDLP